MKKFLLLLLLTAGTTIPVKSQVSLTYFLPVNTHYNNVIPVPETFFGHQIGEWHLSHDKLLYYMLELAESSDRAVWEEYARSHEGRPLGQLIISSPENIRNLEQLRREHLALCDPERSGRSDLKNMPVVIKLGYGIHGNESSAQNASAIVAYHLVAGEGEAIDNILKNTIILIDPALNPDGMQRHSTWVNFTRSLNNNPDPASWEFNESWPGGRTNHYWFDLNRDYIMLQHPESAGRVAAFHRWKPNINTDHHEMGAGETFFFQPGVQSRNNPLTPADNQALTAEIGKYHEKYLNSIGSLYYTEESYDDFYVGKGSSYPDIHGSVGILFEQAGVKGHLRETQGGLLSFPFAIRNQVMVSLSTIEAGTAMKTKLLESQRSFYKDALLQAGKYPVKAFIFTEPADKSRTAEFISILRHHQIKVFSLTKNIERNGITYKPGESYIVPLHQPEFRFIRDLFEPVKEFTDSLFYDISTWVLPMSFNMSYTSLGPKELDDIKGVELQDTPDVTGELIAPPAPYAYLFEWNDYFAPKALFKLQEKGIITRVANDKFVVSDGSLQKNFSYGTILVPVSGQPYSGNELRNIISSVADECRLTIYGTNTGLTPDGIDLGSSMFSVVRKPSVAMIVGDGANSTDAGEIWHMLDTRFEMPVTMITASRFSVIDPGRYNVIIITGSPDISQTGIENLRAWNRKGGTLIGYETGNSWLARNKFAEIDFVPPARGMKTEGIYADRSADMQAQQIPGSIFEVRLDLTHPLCYGYTRSLVPAFKSTATVAKKDPNIYNNPATYTNDPLLSGYCTKENIERIKGSPFVSVHGSRVISIYDNTNFRAIWYGTNKIFMNALFFGQLLR